MAFGRAMRMAVQNSEIGALYMGAPPEGLLADEPLPTEAEERYLTPRFIGNLCVGWEKFVAMVEQKPPEESQFWTILSEDKQNFMGIMHVFKEIAKPGEPLNPFVRPPHDWSTYIFLRQQYWGYRISVYARAARQLAALRHAPVGVEIDALHACVREENVRSEGGLKGLGAVNIGRDCIDTRRTHFVTPNPDTFERYWERATEAGLIVPTNGVRQAFEACTALTRCRLEETAAHVAFL